VDASRVISRGLMRGAPGNFEGKVVSLPNKPSSSGPVAVLQAQAEAALGQGAGDPLSIGSVALDVSPLEEAESHKISSAEPAGRSKGSQIAEARMRGYEGEACGECANFTMVRNGTCLKCDTCGATNGCS